MAQEEKFDLMADLCILAGQAVMQVGSPELRASMRVVLGILGQEVADRTVAQEAAIRLEAAAKSAVKRSTKSGRTASSRLVRQIRLAPCA